MKILVIDGQGGGLGAQIIKELLVKTDAENIIAVGTNALATSAMIKAGATKVATGENAVIVNSRTADVIVGPLGIVIADSLLGEITPKIASAVGSSSAKRVLIPTNKCDNYVVGANSYNRATAAKDAAKIIFDLLC